MATFWQLFRMWAIIWSGNEGILRMLIVQNVRVILWCWRPRPTSYPNRELFWLMQSQLCQGYCVVAREQASAQASERYRQLHRSTHSFRRSFALVWTSWSYGSQCQRDPNRYVSTMYGRFVWTTSRSSLMLCQDPYSIMFMCFNLKKATHSTQRILFVSVCHSGWQREGAVTAGD